MTDSAQSPIRPNTFFCIDGHTCGNPVRLVAAGGPPLERRLHERTAPGLPAALRLDPHRPDVRAARPRHDVGLDPLSAEPGGLRHRGALHRDVGLPAHVRSRHDRHGHLRAGARAGAAARSPACCGWKRRPVWSKRATAWKAASWRRCGSPTSAPTWRPRASRWTARSWAASPSTSPTAVTSMPSSSRRRTTAIWPIFRPATSSAFRRNCGLS